MGRADGDETSGVDLRTTTKYLGGKEMRRRRKCDVRFSLVKKDECRSEEVVEDGSAPCKSVASVGPFRFQKG